MIETSKYLAYHLAANEEASNKFIILTGAFRPECFKESDAEFNVAYALGALNTLTRPGVYICMHGRLIEHMSAYRNETTGEFCNKDIDNI
jgi:L-asparaginase